MKALLGTCLLCLGLCTSGFRAAAQEPDAPTPQPSGALAEQLARLLSEEVQQHDEALTLIVGMGESVVDELEEVAVDTTAPPRHRAGAVYALGRIGAPRSRQVLDGLWATGLDGMGGALAIQTAISLGWYGSFEPLRRMVALGDEILGAKAAVQLGLFQDERSLEVLEEAYASEEYARMRPFFAIALGLLGDNRGEEFLRSGLSTPELRNHCAVALGRLGYAGEVAFELDFAMSDPDPLVRRMALQALIELSPSHVEELLERAAADPDPVVRSQAEAALQDLRERPRRPR